MMPIACRVARDSLVAGNFLNCIIGFATLIKNILVCTNRTIDKQSRVL